MFELTVMVIHCDSRTAPQHPKKAIMKMIEPTTMSPIGKEYAL